MHAVTMRRPVALFVLAVGSAVLASPLVTRPANACGGGVSYGFGSGDIASLAGGALFITDIVFISYDVAHASPNKGPSEAWSKGETYVQVPQVALMGLIMPALPSEALPTAIAFTMLPATLSAHGFYGTNGTWGERWQLPVGIVTTFDVGLVAYDIGSAVMGKRPDELYAFAEIFAASPQVLFGLAFASGASGRTLGTTLALTALPTALIAHGIAVLEVARHSEAEPQKPAATASSGSTPRFSLTPMATPGTIGLSGFGVF